MKYTLQQQLDDALLQIRGKAIEAGTHETATPEFKQAVKEAEERVKDERL